LLAEFSHPGAAMDEENFVRDQMCVWLDLGTWREVFVPHHEVGRPTILAVDFEDEGSLPDVPAHTALSLTFLEHKPRPARRRTLG
jgi:hypothetical protein